MELLLGEVDLLRGAVHVEQTSPHGDRDLIQVANLGEDLFGHLAQADEAALLSEGAAVAEDKLGRRKTPRELEHFIAIPARKGTTIRYPGVVPGIIGKPETTHVLDTVEGDAARHAVPATLIVDGRHVWLNGIVVEGHY